jgi:hypothetical protein
MASALRAKSDEVGSILEWSGMASGGFLRSLWCAAIDASDPRHGVIAPPP